MDIRVQRIINPCNTSIYDAVNMELLKSMTRYYPLSAAADVVWEKVKYVSIIGAERMLPADDGSCPDGGIGYPQRGCYIDGTGSWAMLAGADQNMIQNCLSRCADHLVHLYIGHTELTELCIPAAPCLCEMILIDNPQLSGIHGLDTMPSLQILCISSSLCDFPLDLTPLPRLRKLNLNSCAIKGIRLDRSQVEFGECSLIETKFTDMHFLQNWELLEQLTISGSALGMVPEEIRQLKHLYRMRLTDLVLKELPDWLPELGLTIGRGGTHSIDLSNTKVSGVDMSTFDRSQELIRQWFQKQKQEKADKPLNEIKVVFLGHGSTGKSLTVARLMDEDISPQQYEGKVTPGIAIQSRAYPLADGRQVSVHFWDFGGQDILHSMHRIFLTDRTLYIVMLNARNNNQDEQARYWLHNIQSFAPGCPVLLVLNQIDQNPNAYVNERSLRKKFPQLQQVVRLSALNFSKEEFYQSLTQTMLDQIAELECMKIIFPASWKKIMDQIRQMKDNYIRGTTFKQICEKYGVSSQEDCLELLEWFNDIGISFCCCHGSVHMRDYVVLKPEWITNAIYTIIWNKRNETVNGIVDRDEIYRMLTAESAPDDPRAARYALEDVDYILSITRQFRLSFPMDNMHEFIPMLCQAVSPPESETFPEEPDVIEFRMKYEYLPDNVIHRLMVDMRKDMVPGKVWLAGVFLQQRFNYIDALVKSEDNVLSIYIRAADSSHKAHSYLNTLRGALQLIHEEMELTPPEMFAAYREGDDVEYFPYDMLEGSRKNGQTSLYSCVFRRMIPIDTLLNGTDSLIIRKKKKLLLDIAQSCVQLQQLHFMMNAKENDRNDYLRDALRNKGYIVSDQTHVGIGGKGILAGSLDLQILHEDLSPWTNLEAMNLHSASGSQLQYWENHLDRLLDNYNFAGLPVLFLISYVNTAPDHFHTVCESYVEHIRRYQPPYAKLRYGSIAEEQIFAHRHAYFLAVRCIYDLSGTPITVYHYFVGFHSQDHEKTSEELSL